MACKCCETKECAHKDEKKERIILIVRVILSLFIFIISLFVNKIASNILISIAYLMIAYDVLYKAFKNIIHLELFDECFLMSIASLLALIVPMINSNTIIDSNDGFLVILLYQVGEFLQDLAIDKSNDSIIDMLEVDVDKVIKINSIKEEIIDVNDVKINDIIRVKPGMKIPVDGIIINGSSSINTSMLTGESKPIDVGIDDKVLKGSINNEGSIDIKVLVNDEDTLSNKVKQMVLEASNNKAKSEKFISKFAKIYTPIVIVLSLIVMFIIPIFLGFKEHFMEYLYKGLAIMVISCPCSLVISIPLTYFLGIGKGAKNAILFKGSNHIETLAKANLFAFDKTGTLTKGSFEIVDSVCDNKDEFESIIYNIERLGSHPIAKSIAKHYENVKEVEVKEFTNISGKGAIGLINNKLAVVGNYNLIKENNVDVSKVKSNGTVIYVGYDNALLGYVIINDVIKDDSIESIKKINEKYDSYIISGDSNKVVEEIASKLNIKNYFAEALPDKKKKIIDSLKKENVVCYVGDGINDAACLLSADVGIAMKSLGSDIAISASDVIILDGKVSKVNKAKEIASKVMSIVKENIIFSIIVKTIVIVLSVFITLPMFIAVICDVGVCLLAILNSLRILIGKK